MKKTLFFLFIIGIFISCSKDYETMTTYKITNNIKRTVTNIPELNGTLYEIIVFHYKGGNIVNQDKITKVSYEGGVSATFTISSKIESLQVSYKLLPKTMTVGTPRFYVIERTKIRKGSHNNIIINGDTMVRYDPTKAPVKLVKSIRFDQRPI